MLMRWLTSWRHGRALARTHIQLNALRQCALSAPDDISRDYLIVSANALLGDLQARGIITLAERRDLAREWTKDYVRSCLPAFYREERRGCRSARGVLEGELRAGLASDRSGPQTSGTSGCRTCRDWPRAARAKDEKDGNRDHQADHVLIR
jgi:hypothetical protein